MTSTLPSDASDGLSFYIRQTRAFPILSAEVERSLSERWRERHDASAMRQLVGSHLRLLVKVAMGYRNYGLPTDDLIGEGHLGLMHAVCRFDPDRGARFATYAIWWMRAAIQAYILRNWSLVKIGTTASQKKLFFNLRRVRSRLQPEDHGPLRPEHVAVIAGMLQVPEHEVISVDQRLASRDFSLNTPVGSDGQSEWQAWLPDESDNQEVALAEAQETARRKLLLHAALGKLSGRERQIVVDRRLCDTPVTLRSLSQRYGLSSERIRQIEARALAKLHRSIQSSAPA
jgi:RNA polymerase sigma-32 factor